MNKTDTVIPDRVFKFNESVKKNNGIWVCKECDKKYPIKENDEQLVFGPN